MSVNAPEDDRGTPQEEPILYTTVRLLRVTVRQHGKQTAPYDPANSTQQAAIRAAFDQALAPYNTPADPLVNYSAVLDGLVYDWWMYYDANGHVRKWPPKVTSTGNHDSLDEALACRHGQVTLPMGDIV